MSIALLFYGHQLYKKRAAEWLGFCNLICRSNDHPEAPTILRLARHLNMKDGGPTILRGTFWLSGAGLKKQ